MSKKPKVGTDLEMIKNAVVRNITQEFQLISVDRHRNSSLHCCCSFTGASFTTMATPSPTKLLVRGEFLQTCNYGRMSSPPSSERGPGGTGRGLARASIAHAYLDDGSLDAVATIK
ncbi:hypothetical protein NL676_037069 [Syzygium grande]|nr:hypothetical protein NL676_037069 [Syzygium grande]